MKTYKQHYNECKASYNSNMSVYDVSIHLNQISYDMGVFESVRNEVSKRLNNLHNCIEDKWAIKLDKIKDIKELEIFCQQVMPQIEEKYFGCYLSVDFVHAYKVKTNATNESSWSWHYDDCPKECIKFAIYLNDTDESNGCMQYMSDTGNRVPVVGTYRLDPSAIKGFPPPVFPKTRIPQHVIEAIVNRGGKINNIVGKAGTNFVFTPNIMHRGTIPTSDKDSREAIFFFLRPTSTKREQYISDATCTFTQKQNVKKYILD